MHSAGTLLLVMTRGVLTSVFAQGGVDVAKHKAWSMLCGIIRFAYSVGKDQVQTVFRSQRHLSFVLAHSLSPNPRSTYPIFFPYLGGSMGSLCVDPTCSLATPHDHSTPSEIPVDMLVFPNSRYRFSSSADNNLRTYLLQHQQDGFFTSETEVSQTQINTPTSAVSSTPTPAFTPTPLPTEPAASAATDTPCEVDVVALLDSFFPDKYGATVPIILCQEYFLTV